MGWGGVKALDPVLTPRPPVTTQPIRTAVRNSRIHECGYGLQGSREDADEHVTFCIAAYVCPYPCDVYSVWVFVVALEREGM